MVNALKRKLPEAVFQPVDKKPVLTYTYSQLKRKLSDNSFQPSEKKPKIFNPNCTVGVIQRIKLENFMCHSDLKYEPNQNINFITGANGAGKSSVLQALVLGLGGDSKHTKRYTNLTSFIKKGSTKAVIEITLNNAGEDAYKPDLYGKSIIFERTIKDCGMNSFVLKDANGNVKEKETKRAREEGRRALESFRIQVENPVIILQQDEAKEMLQIKSPHKLYQFFSQATYIKQVVEQYKAGVTDLDVLKRNSKRLEVALRHKLKLLNEKKEIINRAEERDEELKRLRREYACSEVIACGEEVLNIQKTVKDKESQLNTPSEKLISLQNEARSLKDMIIGKEIKTEQERNMFSNQEEELADLAMSINSLKQNEKSSTAELKHCEDATSKINTEVQHLEEQLQELLGQTQKERVQSAIEKTQQVSLLEKSIEEGGKAIKKESSLRLELNSKEQNLDSIAENLDCKKKELEITIDSVRNEISEIERLGNRNLAVYGQKYAMVDAEIQKHQFEQKPYGPVGRYIQLKSPAVPNSNLANLVESVLSGVLKNYLCHSDQDRRTLSKIFDKVFGTGFKPTIVVSKFLSKRHNVAPAKVPLTVMDLLEVKEVAVFNFLVDRNCIESVAVCLDQNEAKNMTTRPDRVPKNLSYAITTDFYQFIPPTSSSSYRSYFMEKTAQGLLSGSSSEKLRQKRILLEENKSKLKENNREKSRMQGTRAEIGIQKNNTFKKIQELQMNLASEKKKLNDMMSTSESDTSQTLVENLKVKKQQKGDLEGKLESIRTRRSKIEKELKAVRDTHNSKARELTSLKDKWCQFDSESTKMNVLYVSKCKEIANQEKLVEKLREDLKNWEIKRETAMLAHKKAQTLAKRETQGEKITPSESREQLKAKLKLLIEKKQKSYDDAGLHKIICDASELERDCISHTAKFKMSKMFIEQVNKMNNDRANMFLLIRKRIVNMITRKFNFMCQAMAKDIGCNIFLRINVQTSELHFEFKPLGGGAQAKTNVTSLSGGEKSFAQMALICSLWDHTQSPFRCLDEWDVFLDQVNREKIQSKLYKFGLKQNDKQFIFLSPQGAADYSDISPEERSQVSITEIKKS